MCRISGAAGRALIVAVIDRTERVLVEQRRNRRAVRNVEDGLREHRGRGDDPDFRAVRDSIGCLDRIRRRRPEYELDHDFQADSAAGPAEGLQASQTGIQLKAAISALKEPYRSLVVLRDVQQHSYAEVAGALELNMSQVKVYLHRARKQLREQLAPIVANL